MNDPISALIARQRIESLAQSALPHAPVVPERRTRLPGARLALVRTRMRTRR